MSVITEVGKKMPVTRKTSDEKERLMGVCGARGRKKISIASNGITAAIPKPSEPKRRADRIDNII
jgi:hypothetical protein